MATAVNAVRIVVMRAVGDDVGDEADSIDMRDDRRCVPAARLTVAAERLARIEGSLSAEYVAETYADAIGTVGELRLGERAVVQQRHDGWRWQLMQRED